MAIMCIAAVNLHVLLMIAGSIVSILMTLSYISYFYISLFLANESAESHGWDKQITTDVIYFTQPS